MSTLSRRQFLAFFGASAGAAAFGPGLGEALLGLGSTAAQAQTTPLTFTPLYLPSPLPIHTQKTTYLPTGIGTSVSKAPSANPKEPTYTVVDDVAVPPEYERYVIVGWGDRVFPNPQEYFGYNCDYTGYVPINGERDGYLFVNHEYVSYPFSKLAPEAPPTVVPFAETYGQVIRAGFLPEIYTSTGGTLRPINPADPDRLKVDGEFMYNQGVSIVRITRLGSESTGRFAVNADKSKNFRIHGLSGLGLNKNPRPDGTFPSSWGPDSYQQGDDNYLIGTGPAAVEVFPLSSDGFGNKIIGTAYNCSGGTTPWGTNLTAEENFQGGAGAFFVGVQEAVKPNGTQLSYVGAAGTAGGTTGETFGLVGEKYGWMVEIDPASPTTRGKKHTALGRFRHENIAMRAVAGRKLIAYMGDDRRGGHTWKFVSNGTVTTPSDKANSKLFEDGKLYVAQFNPNGTGRWIELSLETATNPIPPTVLSSVEFAALGSAQRNGLLPLPRRSGIAGQVVDGGSFGVNRINEATVLPEYAGKKLKDFYKSQGAVLTDAFLAANLVGGTPTARPEDIEISPRFNDSVVVFISYTDGAPGGDGYPDSRIFQVAKLSPAVNATQQSGGLYRITEDSKDGTGLTFKWVRFNQGGEAGSIDGDGFAAVDNLVFDNLANVWGVTDMSTSTHNGFNVGAVQQDNTINHAVTGNVANLTGVFGNNWMFYVPTTGPDAGQVIPFAHGPVRCEITGPTFVGNTLVASVQHPGEDCPVDDGTTFTRTIEMLALDGTLFNQTRTAKRGSAWPGNLPASDFASGVNPKPSLPRPSVIGIRRKNGGRFI